MGQVEWPLDLERYGGRSNIKQVVHFSNEFECTMMHVAPTQSSLAKPPPQFAPVQDDHEDQEHEVSKVGFCGFGRNRATEFVTQAPREGGSNVTTVNNGFHSVSQD